MHLAAPTNVFNPPNPNATGMNFNSFSANGGAGEPSIGASLMDAQTIGVAAKLQTKKKKKKAKKRINPDAFELPDDLDLGGPKGPK